MATTPLIQPRSKPSCDTHGLNSPASESRHSTDRLSARTNGPRCRPGACSIDIMAVVHNFKFGRGPNPSSGDAIWDAEALGLITTSPAAVTLRGEQALAEHGWLTDTARRREDRKADQER
jgi:hypothetical protein